MAKGPTISTIASGYYSTTKLNSNFTNIDNAFDNTLSLDGSAPNAMNADLDLNGNDILNINDGYIMGRLFLNGERLTPSAVTVTVAAVDVTVADAGGYYAGADVEAVLQDIGANYAALAQNETVTGSWTFPGLTTTADITGDTFKIDDANGRIGIGELLPDKELHMTSASNPTARWENTTSGSTTDFLQSNSIFLLDIDSANGVSNSAFRVDIDNVERMYLTTESLDISLTGSVKIASGTTAQRPASPVAGDIRWNSTESSYEGYNGSAWTQFADHPFELVDVVRLTSDVTTVTMNINPSEWAAVQFACVGNKNGTVNDPRVQIRDSGVGTWRAVGGVNLGTNLSFTIFGRIWNTDNADGSDMIFGEFCQDDAGVQRAYNGGLDVYGYGTAGNSVLSGRGETYNELRFGWDAGTETYEGSTAANASTFYVWGLRRGGNVDTNLT